MKKETLDQVEETFNIFISCLRNLLGNELFSRAKKMNCGHSEIP